MNHTHQVVLLIALTAACGGGFDENKPPIDIPYEPTLPSVPGNRSVAPYTGNDPYVLDAQLRMRTGFDLHRKVVQRSCSGTAGVCHNQKEYPDMRSAEAFLALVDAPCNVVPKNWSTVFDRCEPVGDRLRFSDPETGSLEIGWIELISGEHVDYEEQEITPTLTSPGLHLRLHDPVVTERSRLWTTAEFRRSFIGADSTVNELVYASLQGKWWLLEGGTHLFLEIPGYRREQTEALIAVGVLQGDANRNEIFGARLMAPVPLIAPGKPEESYLVARLRGQMQGQTVPGTRMPLANLPPTIPDMLALLCFIEGLPADGTAASLSWPIDYANCSYIANPEGVALTGGGGPTWNGRVWPILQANCGGCHGGADPYEGLDLVSDGTHGRLFGTSGQIQSLKLIDPGSPQSSYLWLKVTGDASIEGDQMPIDPLGGTRTLTPDELADIQAWITAGALED